MAATTSLGALPPLYPDPGMDRGKPFYAAVWCLLWLLALIIAPTARAQTISNTAHASWSLADQSYSVASNSVRFDVVRSVATLQTFVGSQIAANSLSFAASRCNGALLGAAPGTSGASQATTVTQASTIHIGDVLYIRLSAPIANQNPALVESIQAKLVTTGGDSETIEIFETAANSGIFGGAITTVGLPPQPQTGDCRLSVASGHTISVAVQLIGANSGPVQNLASAQVEVLADPYGLVFDSEDGTPIDGAKITLVDAATGVPARVFAPDGVTSWPSSVISGQKVTDSAGNSYDMLPGEYRFPLAYLGSYRLVVEPPSGVRAPSTATAAQLSGIVRPDGAPVIIAPASYGGVVTLVNTDAIRIDIPVDRPPVAISLTKSVSRQSAQPGDIVFYTVIATNTDPVHVKRNVTLVDTPSYQLRLRTKTVHVDSVRNPSAVVVAPNGASLTIKLGDMAPGVTRRVTYAMSVRPDAQPGQALNKAVATDSRGLSGYASAVVKIEEDSLSSRMTLIGRIAGGSCTRKGPHSGIAGVRVMLEDGTFAITDSDGRYHFEGLLPGTHVVQVMESTLPEGGRFLDCGRSTRQAGSAISRFVTGQGGSLAVADFYADVAEKPAAAPGADTAKPVAGPNDVATDRAAAGGDTDWLTVGDGPNDFLFPAVDYNPRAPAARVVIRHRPGQKVELSANGVPVAALAFDGARTSADRAYAVSIWRGIPLDKEVTRLTATIRNGDGTVADQLSRDVHFNHVPVSVQVVPQLTHLVADGRTRPVLALRVLDRSGRPVHAGISGEFALGAPYESAEAIDAMQSRALSGLGRSAPHWTVKGDDGIALIELAPTMVSGALNLEFLFSDGQQKRRQTIESWVVPGDLKWTLVGLVEGAVGSRSLANAMERTGQFDSDLGRHARTAFYAKGRVLGRYLLTAAYDSAKQRNTQRLLGAIDPRAYYTVFADGSTRRFDAASRDKLYVRIESRAFTAVFGDFETGFGQTQLARYQRTLTGGKVEATLGRVHVQAFGAKVASTHKRDEMQGGGISGPYRLSNRAIIANSETVSIEVRDRFRSERVVETRTLSRFADYDLDLISGTISFKEPVLSRDALLNPQFIVVDYDVDPVLNTGGSLAAGVRTSWTSANGKLRVGASGVTEKGDVARGSLVAVDLRVRPGKNTEIRAEAGVSRTLGVDSQAWLIEAEHHDARLDLLAYAHSADNGYGVGQSRASELGRRKLGVDARYRLNEIAALTASAWHDESLTDISHREALQLKGEMRTKLGAARLGLTSMYDTQANGTANHSNLMEAGVSRKFLGNRLEVDAATSFAIDSSASIDAPTRHALTMRYALTSRVKLMGTYEIANGEAIHARTARAGLEVQPWKGARALASFGEQQIAEYGARSFAAFGLTQSLDVTSRLMVDATVDASKVLGGFSAAQIVNAAQPLASGGQMSTDGNLAENFTAVTLGASWRHKLWSVTARAEMRDGDLAKRRGLTFGAIRQLGDGKMVGAGFTLTRANSADGSQSALFDGAIAWANRPAYSPFAVLAKLEFRADTARAATLPSLSASGAAGLGNAASSSPLVGAANARSHRIIGSVSANWSPRGRRDDEFVQRSEVKLFAAVRHNLDRYDGFDLAGTTLMAAVDATIGIGEKVEIGGAVSVRRNLADNSTSFSAGPRLGFVPTKDVLVTVGYNIAGYRDRDFSEANATTKGVFANLRMKFDSSSFGFLGLGNRAGRR